MSLLTAGLMGKERFSLASRNVYGLFSSASFFFVFAERAQLNQQDVGEKYSNVEENEWSRGSFL